MYPHNKNSNQGHEKEGGYVNNPYGDQRGLYTRSPHFTPPNNLPRIPSVPSVGSLGTPKYGFWNHTPPQYGRSGPRGNSSHTSSLDPSKQGMTLVPTRPLLKALSKLCRPNPPWCVGAQASALSLSEELSYFSSFITPTSEENIIYEQNVQKIIELLQKVWPDASLFPKGITVAIAAHRKEICSHFYAIHCNEIHSVKDLDEIGIKSEFHIEHGKDNRNLPAFICTNCVTGLKACVTYGPDAEKCQPCAQILKNGFLASKPAQDVLLVLLALLQQNRILDDGGLNQTLFSGEALAVMLLSVVNSYSKDLVLDSGRLLIDFFLTFGFTAYFNPLMASVSVTGMQPPTPKVHPNAQLSVIDPGDGKTNLTPSLDRVSSLQTVFTYCYSALNQYTQVSSGQRRAQSILSTIIGGEPYWIRVFRLYEQNIEPYHSFLLDNKQTLQASQF